MAAYYYPTASASSSTTNSGDTTYQSNSGYNNNSNNNDDEYNYIVDYNPHENNNNEAYAHDSFVSDGYSASNAAGSSSNNSIAASSIPNHISPLASLVRRASSRKFGARREDQHAQGQDARYTPSSSSSSTDLNSNSHTGYNTNTNSNHYNDYDYDNNNNNNNNPSTSNTNPIPRRLMTNLRLDTAATTQTEKPPSPLLHSHFARASIATESSGYNDDEDDDDRSRYSSSSTHNTESGSGAALQHRASQRSAVSVSSRYEYEYFRDTVDDGSSVYSQSTTGPALRDSWGSTATVSLNLNNTTGKPLMPLRAVTAATSAYASVDAGMHSEGVRVTPQLPADMREQKRRVLERNMNRMSSAESVRGAAAAAAGTALGIPQVRVRPPSSYSVKSATPSMLTTPQEYLQQGIQHHEANRLGESARCFERSAIEGGGCGVGMLMYGLTLRHGWGCAKNEKMGFKWLMKAAEHAVGDLERLRTGGGAHEVIETELVLAIYEVGQCFFHGWGVAKDQKMAVSYYSVAARLGDGDAQADYAYCLANGKGCKKDKKEAAEWYRKAIAQGQSDVGLAWIYKDKYC